MRHEADRSHPHLNPSFASLSQDIRTPPPLWSHVPRVKTWPLLVKRSYVSSEALRVKRTRLFGSFLAVNCSLLAHGGEDNDVFGHCQRPIQLFLGTLRLLTGVLSLFDEKLLDLVANFALGNLDVVLGGAVIRHEREETVVRDIKLSYV